MIIDNIEYMMDGKPISKEEAAEIIKKACDISISFKAKNRHDKTIAVKRMFYLDDIFCIETKGFIHYLPKDMIFVNPEDYGWY